MHPQEDYIDYDKDIEDNTQFYPLFPLKKFPKLYRVNHNTDKDACTKNFTSHSQLWTGFFQSDVHVPCQSHMGIHGFNPTYCCFDFHNE